MRRWKFRRGGEVPDRGAALVEFALIAPVILLLTFGLIEFALAFSNSATVSNATRSAARIASAEPRQTSFAVDAAKAAGNALASMPAASPQEVWIYLATPGTGLPDSGGFSNCGKCVVYRWDAVQRAFDTDSPLVDGWKATDQDACAGTGDELGVYIKATYTFTTNLFGPSRTLKAHTVMRLEPVPSTQQCRP